MAKKYYAVAKGRIPGIYFSWEDCKKQIDHFSGAVYKSFPSVAEAEIFIKNVEENVSAKNREDIRKETDGNSVEQDSDSRVEEFSTEEHLVAYVDGSYDHSQRKYAYGCALVLPDKVVTLNGDGAEEDYVSMRNVAGEIFGSQHAILWAIEHHYSSISIYYDYAGIENWANGIWKANKSGTKKYQAFIEEKRKYIQIYFHKVAAHTGVQYNEMADQLAKKALGIL